MTDLLLTQLGDHIKELRLLPSYGGRFEVTVDDTLIFSKEALGRHADPQEVLVAVQRKQPITE